MTSNLTKLETKRASTYGRKLSTLDEQWRDAQQLLTAGIQETARAERLILGSALVHQARADAMLSIYNDIMLDDELNSVIDESQQASLYEARVTQGFESLAESQQQGGMLTSLVESQSTVADQFAEDALLVATHIAKEMTDFHESLQSQVNDITTKGNAILAELRFAEDQVLAAWGAYNNVSSNGSGRRSSWIGNSNNTTSVEQLDKTYGQAVVQQTLAWEMNSAKVEELLDSVIAIETHRRAKLQELLRDYVPGQRKLFSNSASAQNKVIEELKLDDDNSRFYPYVELAERQEKNDFEARELPLTSNLVAAIKIVERKKAPKSVAWQKVVAVVTKDDYLHLFEMPSSSSTAISNPEQVFMELLPSNTPLFPSEGSSASDDANITETAAASTPSKSEFNPLESWFLPNCSIKTARGNSQRDIEVTTKAGRFSRRKKKLLLRTDSMDDTSEWIDILQRKEKSTGDGRDANPNMEKDDGGV